MLRSPFMADSSFSPLQRVLLAMRGTGYTPAWLIHAAINVLSPVAWINHQGWKQKARNRSGLQVHLGCGPVYLPGWVNTEILPIWKCDAWLDLRHGLPLADNSVRRLYANQVLEHFTLEAGTALLAECYRVLEPGGALRLAVPDKAKADRALDEQNLAFFAQQQPVTDSTTLQAAYDDYVECQGHHLVHYDFEVMHKTLASVGDWAEIVEADSSSNQVLNREEKSLSESRWPDIHQCCLVVEAVKAG